MVEKEPIYTQKAHKEHNLEFLCSKERVLKDELINLQRELKKAQEEVKRIKSLPLMVGQFFEMVDENNAIVGTGQSSTHMVRVLSTVDRELLTPNCSVALHRHSYALVGTLPPDVGSGVTVLRADEKPDCSYMDIGGMDSQKQEIREAVELPLTESDMYAQIGVDPPRGVLLYGPPGTGKCLGRDTPVLMHDESFRPVQDVKAGDRVMGDDGTPRTVGSVTTGRSEMARVTLNEGAVFTCNMPHVLSLKMAAPITSDKCVVTHHTIERDAEGLVVKITPVVTPHPTEEAAQAVIDEILASKSHQGTEVVHPDTTIDISVRDLLAEQHAGVKPQLLAYHPDGRTESMTIDRIGEGEYFGFTLDGNRRFIITENRIVTHNTMLAKAVAHHTKAAFIRVNGSEFIQKYLGDGPRMVRDVFRLARESSPSIVFVDEIDSIATKRFDANTGGDREVQRVLLELLNQMDGFDQTTNVKVIMATNRPDTLDPALTRPGRLDRKIECPLPDRRQKRLVFQVCTSKMTLEPDVDLEDLVVRPDKLSGADIHSVCLEAGMRAVRAKRMCVSMKDFDDAYKEVLRKETEADRFKFYQ